MSDLVSKEERAELNDPKHPHSAYSKAHMVWMIHRLLATLDAQDAEIEQRPYEIKWRPKHCTHASLRDGNRHLHPEECYRFALRLAEEDRVRAWAEIERMKPVVLAADDWVNNSFLQSRNGETVTINVEAELRAAVHEYNGEADA